MSEESNNNPGYLFRITYKEYVSLMKKWIEKTKTEALFYLEMLSKCHEIIDVPNEGLKQAIDQYVCEYYKNKFFSSLESLLENMDTLELVRRMRRDFVFAVDGYGILYAFYVPRYLQRKFKRENIDSI